MTVTQHHPATMRGPVRGLSHPMPRRPARSWWRPLAVLGAGALVFCVTAALTPAGLFPPGDLAWWVATMLMHAPFAVILLFLTAGLVERTGYFLRGRRAEPSGSPPRVLPRVCVQLPMFNEAAVAERAIAAAGNLLWARDRLDIQVLDDSTDPGSRVAVDDAVAALRARGVRCTTLRRSVRSGYKAGALESGRLRTDAEYLAVFDADFTPHPDFLLRIIPNFYDTAGRRMDDVAVVQARWTHLNRGESALTRAQSLWVDDHHVLQMSWRSAMWRFVNFTGTAGVWRADAIDRVGGWNAASLVEDCELSFRALFGGFRTRFVKEICAPAELPGTYRAYRAQQKRWTQGWAQLQRLHARTLLRTFDTGPVRRLHLAYHMGISWQWPLWGVWMLLLPVLVIEGFWFGAEDPALGFAVYVAPVLLWLVFAAVTTSVETAIIERDRSAGILARGISRIAPYAVLNTGMLPHQAAAFCEGLFGPLHSEFVRTPKAGTRGSRTGESVGSLPPASRVPLAVATVAEVFFVLYQLGWAVTFAAHDLEVCAAAAAAVAVCVVVVSGAAHLETWRGRRAMAVGRDRVGREGL